MSTPRNYTRRQIKRSYKKLMEAIAKEKRSQEGTTNVYHCGSCGHSDKYLFKATGVTPPSFLCSKCGERSKKMRDQTYMASEPHNRTWYRPDLNETLTYINDSVLLDHILHGGLMPRELNSNNAKQTLKVVQ